MIAPEAVVTFDRPVGFRIIKSLGLTRAKATRPRNLLRATFRSIGMFIGLTPLEFLTDAERARADAVSALLERAEQLGANGIVGLQFEARESSDGSTVVSAVGEAVVLEPEPRGART
jgi:uncharacterized protein YbjQ (UPF0145 family)